MSLIEQLRAEHESLRQAMDEVRDLGVGTAEGRPRLWAMRGLLTDHLQKEDRQLYPALRAIEGSVGLAKSFQEEMARITTRTLAFFDRYAEEIDDSREFARELGQVRALLAQRMIREETRLYPVFAEIQGSAAPA